MMINFLSQMNLIPKNFIVASMIDTLKENPETGAEKVFEMADKLVKEPKMIALLEQVKDAYYTNPTIRMYSKNLIYNTRKNCLNHLVQNILIKHLLEGSSKRERLAAPHAIVLNTEGMTFDEVDHIISQAKNLSIHLIMLTGGKLAKNPRTFELYEQYADIQFLVFTKSEALTMDYCENLAEAGNVVPLVMTNEAVPHLEHLKVAGLLYGIITWEQDLALLPFIRQGARFHWYMASHFERDFKQRVEATRGKLPYVAMCVQNEGGKLTFAETINEEVYRITFPEINKLDLDKKSLNSLFKMW